MIQPLWATVHYYTSRMYYVQILTVDGSSTQPHFDIPLASQIHYSCSVNWKNQMIIFGGEDLRRQINQVQGCSLEKIGFGSHRIQLWNYALLVRTSSGTLAFDHDGGACTSHNDKIYLCFSWEGDEKLCRQASGPLEAFSEMQRSNYEHTLTGMAASDSKLLA